MPNPTLADVAREAGVAISTASIVLNEGRQLHQIAPETRERIRKAAHQVKYRPNAVAQLTKLKRTGAVALLQSAETGHSSLNVELLYGISEELQKRDIALSFMRMDDKALIEQEPRFLRRREVDGILINYNVNLPQRLIDFIRHYEIPAVFLNTRTVKNAVYFDHEEAARQAVERLAAAGHRRITLLHFTGAHNHYSVDDSVNGYLKAMNRLGLEPRIADQSVPRHERLKASLELLSGRKAPTAILALALSSIVPVIQAAGILGLSIPERLSVCSFGEEGIGSMLNPQPGCIFLPWREAGRVGVRMLLRQIEGEASRPVSGRVKCGWNEGAGTIGAPGKGR